jgi:hypothetical protein
MRLFTQGTGDGRGGTDQEMTPGAGTGRKRGDRLQVIRQLQAGVVRDAPSAAHDMASRFMVRDSKPIALGVEKREIPDTFPINMKSTPLPPAAMRRFALLCLLAAGALAAQDGGRLPAIPEDLLDDDHIREEFGINEWTTPSIRRVFDTMGSLGSLSYDDLRRRIPDKPPGDRVAVSLGLGALIADGFLVVQCEKVEAMEDVGRAMIKFAKALGAGDRMNRHTQSLLENSVQGDWESLRVELAKTQADVEAEMLQLRDVEIAHLISLGGWLRGLEISTNAVLAAYTEEKSRALGRRDIVEYYAATLEFMNPDLTERKPVKMLREGLAELAPLLDAPEGKSFSLEEVRAMNVIASRLAKEF